MNKALSLMDSFIDPSDPDVDEPISTCISNQTQLEKISGR